MPPSIEEAAADLRRLIELQDAIDRHCREVELIQTEQSMILRRIASESEPAVPNPPPPATRAVKP